MLKNPVINYVLIALGVVALAAALWWTFGPHHHHYREYILYVVAVILIAGGVIGQFVLKPKATTTIAK